MSELFLSSTSTSKSQLFIKLINSHFSIFFTFIFSHPLYFFYFIFFSPYLLKLLSFLSPLFLTTSLLLLAFLTTISPPHHAAPNSTTKLSFLIAAYNALLDKLCSNFDDNHDEEELLCLEDFEVFRIVFDTAISHQIEVLEVGEIQIGAERKNSNWAAEDIKMEEEKKLEQLDEFDNTNGVELKKIEAAMDTNAHKAVEKSQENSSVLRNGSEAESGNNRKSPNYTVEIGKGGQNHSERILKGQMNSSHRTHEEEENSSLKVESSRALNYINLGNYGSMRKEKDWKRTLACKLFEERNHNNNSDGGGGNEEGMDLLWETYESSESKPKGHHGIKNNKKNKNKKFDVKYFVEENEEEEGGEDEESNGQLCCLQALKFSAGKMNLGMGRLRISKAIKGIGWLHQVSSRHSKKVHNGDRF
ncbi:hypothetical protein M9H77_01168 [Catharanthus roseus]|uniref:Uncharacterized protein n=1 Tax=Catharanthus roseus TaxID=4058 RepID=A0ACC0C4V1_CATRO|nr:hypothetical protein M9H77_01168 [Catharanthus roseus]